MTSHSAPPSPDGPPERDTGTRRVTRVTRGAAAAAILATAVFGGLAAEHSRGHSGAASATGTAATVTASPASSTDDGSSLQDAVPPTATQQAPAATSGAS